MKRLYLLQILLIWILLLFQSCDVQVMDDHRILIKGRIVDSENNPLQNISVRTKTYGAILGESLSDANGEFQFTSLESKDYNPTNIAVNIKPNKYYSGDYDLDLIENPVYTAKQYFNDLFNRKAVTYNLGQIQLNEAASLKVFFNNIPGDNNRVAYKFEYQSAICEIDLNDSTSENCLFDFEYYQQLDINSNDFESIFYSQLGTTVLLKYILNNEPEQTISIPLTNLENTYVFEY